MAGSIYQVHKPQSRNCTCSNRLPMVGPQRDTSRNSLLLVATYTSNMYFSTSKYFLSFYDWLTLSHIGLFVVSSSMTLHLNVRPHDCAPIRQSFRVLFSLSFPLPAALVGRFLLLSLSARWLCGMPDSLNGTPECQIRERPSGGKRLSEARLRP